MKNLYAKHLTLLTDLYQLTMAYGYWKSGRAEDEAVFNLFFRELPFGGGYAVACGLEYVIDYVEDFVFGDEELDYLATLTGSDGKPLFETAFLDYLRNLCVTCDIDAVAEGSVVFPNEPILRVKGPILQCQLLETPLLNVINFQTLVATKSARICQAAGDDPVLEFGLRRAQGSDGAIAASRAAYVGGCVATSNVMAGRLHGIPVKGTHAHSWVMAFDSEMEAFETYAQVMPNNCVFLVDTYDTEEGVKHAVAAGSKLRERGYEMLGIRLDSGDLCELSKRARRILDDGGFPNCRIVASNDLDEYLVTQLKAAGAKIDIWGIGTRLITAYDQPALGGVYKIAAIRRAGGQWEYTIKLSDDAVKVSTPGIQQIRRYRVDGRLWRDAIYNEEQGIKDDAALVDYVSDNSVTIPAEATWQDLLVPVFRDGKCVYNVPALSDVRTHALAELQALPDSLKALAVEATHIVALAEELYSLKKRLMEEMKQ